MNDYEQLKDALKTAMADLAILSGDEVGPSDATWQDVAGTCAVNLRHAARLVDKIRTRPNAFPVFPSPGEVFQTE